MKNGLWEKVNQLDQLVYLNTKVLGVSEWYSGGVFPEL